MDLWNLVVDFYSRNPEFVRAVIHWTIIIGLFFWACAQIEKMVRDVLLYYKWMFVALPQKRRDRIFLNNIRKVGQILAFNQEAGITGVTLLWRLNYEVAFERENISKDHKGGELFRKLSKPTRVMVVPTFTFASPDEGNQYVTGNNRDMERVLDFITESIGGYAKDAISPDVWKNGGNLLIRRDRSLIVPFVREGHLPNGELQLSLEAQVEIFSKYSVGDAKFELVHHSRKPS